MIYEFKCRGLNATTSHLDPQDAMHFGDTLHRTLKRILHADPVLGSVYLSKVNLANAYMRIWVRMEDIPLAAFLIPKKTPTNPQLFGFHLSLPMGYISSAT